MNKQSLFDDFESEIQEVQSTLLSATGDLSSPLGDLVRAQIRQSQPHICAAVVLTVSSPILPTSTELQGEAGQRRKRILLAAALEMLHIALNVHRLLVEAALAEQQAGGDIALDRSFVGSTILAGDYCFSRAAQMAAQTDHPHVVQTFALALQAVSEGILREQFQRESAKDKDILDGASPSKDTDKDIERDRRAPATKGDDSNIYDERRQLLLSGAQAASFLVDLPKNEEQQSLALSQDLASQWALYRQGVALVGYQPLRDATAPLPIQWQVLYQWLNGHRTNGEPRLISSTNLNRASSYPQ